MSPRPRQKRLGQALVEFTIAAPVLFLMLFGVIEGGRAVWTNHEVVNGTREGARLAMVAGATGGPAITEASITQRVLDSTSGLDAARLTVIVTNLGGQPGETVIVQSTYEYQPIISMVFGAGSFDLTSRSEVIIQR